MLASLYRVAIFCTVISVVLWNSTHSVAHGHHIPNLYQSSGYKNLIFSIEKNPPDEQSNETEHGNRRSTLKEVWEKSQINRTWSDKANRNNENAQKTNKTDKRRIKCLF